MDWKKFFNDVTTWMDAANIMLKNHPIDSEEYWKWVVETMGRIEKRYDRHPLVVSILVTIIKYQDQIALDVIHRREEK